jgi:hypothetical protein
MANIIVTLGSVEAFHRRVGGIRYGATNGWFRGILCGAGSSPASLSTRRRHDRGLDCANLARGRQVYVF